MSTPSTVFYGNHTGNLCSSTSSGTPSTTTTSMTPTSMIPPLNPPRFGTTIPNRIFVGGITTDTSECDLEGLFGRFGNVNAVKIINDRAGVPRGYGFVTFDSEEEAKRVLREGDNLVLKGRKLNVAIAVKKQPIGRVDLVPFYGGLEALSPPLLYHPHGSLASSNGLLFNGQPPALQSISSPMTAFSPLFQEPYSPFLVSGIDTPATAALMAAFYGVPSGAFQIPPHHHPHVAAETQGPSSVTNGAASGHHHQQPQHHSHAPSTQASHQSSQYLFYPNSPAAGTGHQNTLPGHFTFMSNASPNPGPHHHHQQQQATLHSQMSSHHHHTPGSTSGVTASHPTASASPSSSSTTWTQHPPPPPATSYIMPPVLVNNHHMSHVS